MLQTIKKFPKSPDDTPIRYLSSISDIKIANTYISINGHVFTTQIDRLGYSLIFSEGDNSFIVAVIKNDKTILNEYEAYELLKNEMNYNDLQKIWWTNLSLVVYNMMDYQRRQLRLPEKSRQEIVIPTDWDENADDSPKKLGFIPGTYKLGEMLQLICEMLQE